MKQRPDGLYQKSKRISGQRIFGYGRTVEEAEADLLSKLAPIPSTGGTLHEIAKTYWYPALEQLAPLSKRRYTDLYVLHIRKLCELPTLDRGIVQEWVNELSKTLAPNTVRLTYGLFRQIVLIGLDEEFLTKDPCRRIKLPARPEPRERTMPVVDALALLEKVKGTPLSAPVFLASVLGLRRGEVTGLKWEALDRVSSTLRIGRQRQNLKKYGGLKERAPKRGKSRTLHLTKEIVAEIDARGDLDSPYICTYKGKPWDPERLTNYYEQKRGAIGLPSDWTFHDLRHLAGGLLDAADVQLTGISAVYGHSSTKQSEQYVSRSGELRRKDMKALSDMLFPVDKP